MIRKESDISVAVGKPAAEVIYTAIEMSNHEEDNKGILVRSEARTLTITMSELAKKYGVQISGENALPGFDDSMFWNNMLGAINDGYTEATFLRMNNFDQETNDGAKNLKDLTSFINKVNNPALTHTSKSEQLVNILEENIDTSIQDLEQKYPDLFSYDAVSELIKNALVQEKRGIAFDYLSKAKRIISVLNRNDMNSLLNDIEITKEAIEKRDKDTLVNRIATYYSQVFYDQDPTKIILEFVDYLTTFQNGNIDQHPDANQLSVIIAGTLERDFKDSLYYCYKKIANSRTGEDKVTLQNKLAIFSLLFTANNTNINYNGVNYKIEDFFTKVLSLGEIGIDILDAAKFGLVLPEYAIMDANNKTITISTEKVRDLVNKIESKLKTSEKLVK